jgi:hypothetical protein
MTVRWTERRVCPRSGTVRAVSTGTVGFFLGDYTTPAYIAFPGQPQALVLRDADLDTSPAAEKVQVVVKSLQKIKAEEATSDAAATIDIFAVKDDEKDQWKERDRITMTLTNRAKARISERKLCRQKLSSPLSYERHHLGDR